MIKKIFKYWFPLFIWALLIYLFSARSTGVVTEIHWGDFIIKKTAHIIEYAVLTLLSYRAMKESGISKTNAALFSILFAVFYGATDEFHQAFTPGREPKARDVMFDTIGSVIAIYSVWNLLPKAPTKLRNLAEKFQLS
ncbi:MAG: VanZ-like protein [Microgenomates group bacterium GW2011_GWC1_37_8]|uniref:VanZ family protein n=1 Tax=Candidatus Woesebacteria bacterium GW2011_GWB1_38_8 TaxID=1618570 RepID=A0A0G0LEB9_9BACT|nr:MAG: VanZ-like protein [Microgenomates group bacterium GW2011_GWC1_37_8]KKQ86275.1 MAG: VanZ family protein [Candidatus Woesebacteria bacterium GW2011_GWB1_38_8]